MQKTVRGYLVRQKYGPRIATLKNIRNLDTNLKKIEESAEQLKKDKNIVINEINNLKGEIAAAIGRIKVNNRNVVIIKTSHILIFLFRKMIKSTKKPLKAFTKTW